MPTRPETTPGTAGPTPAPVEDVLRLACRAPSVHNTQPWLWRLEGRAVELYADPTRRLTHTDPDGRDLQLSCGAALHHLQVAARGLGWRPEVQRLPDPRDRRHLATVTLTPAVAATPAVEQLRALRRRRTDRRHYTSWPVPPERLAALAEVARGYGVRAMSVSDEADRARLRALAREADELQRDDPDYRAELETAIRDSAAGLSPGHLPASPSPTNRTFPPGDLAEPSREPMGDPEGVLVLCTPADDVHWRLRAGEALSALWLHATAEGLSVLPLSQATEVEQTREAVAAELLEGWGCPQITLRVGWPPIGREDLPETPRRDLEDMLFR